MVIDEVVYLEHFGVKGMRWGVRKAEEKGSSTKAPKETKEEKRERKAKKFDDVSAMYQVKMRDLDVKISKAGYFRKNSLERERRNVSALNDRAIKDAEAKRQGKLTSTQKKLIIGASVTAGVLAAYGINNMVQSGEMNRSILKGRAFIAGNKGSVWNRDENLAIRNLNVDEIMSDVVSKANPNYGSPGTIRNCRRATYAYEMRRRGFDVTATRTTNAHGQNLAGMVNVLSPGKEFVPTSKIGQMRRYYSEGLYETSRGKHFSTPLRSGMAKLDSLGMKNKIVAPEGGRIDDAIFQTLGLMPNGSRGELGVKWGMGGGHSMAWEVVKGRPVIFDAQLGKWVGSAAELSHEYGHMGFDQVGFNRLDNVKLNEQFLMRWLKNAK